METIHIRRATTHDLPVLLEFEQGVIHAERPFDPTLKREATRYYDLEMMLTARHIALMVAETDNRLIGSGYARLETAKPYLSHSRYAYLGFMYVVPAFRGRGVNRLILAALEKWVQEMGVSELRLEVYFENTAAIRAYEKAGFVKHMIEMRKPLGDQILK